MTFGQSIRIVAVLLAVSGILTVSYQAFAASQPGDVVTISDSAFLPAELTVAAGTTVTWSHQDSRRHNVVSGDAGAAGAGAVFASPILSQGQSFSFSFAAAGRYPYFCDLHPEMRGTVVVSSTSGGAAPPASTPAATPVVPGDDDDDDDDGDRGRGRGRGRGGDGR